MTHNYIYIFGVHILKFRNLTACLTAVFFASVASASIITFDQVNATDGGTFMTTVSNGTISSNIFDTATGVGTITVNDLNIEGDSIADDTATFIYNVAPAFGSLFVDTSSGLAGGAFGVSSSIFNNDVSDGEINTEEVLTFSNLGASVTFGSGNNLMLTIDSEITGFRILFADGDAPATVGVFEQFDATEIIGGPQDGMMPTGLTFAPFSSQFEAEFVNSLDTVNFINSGGVGNTLAGFTGDGFLVTDLALTFEITVESVPEPGSMTLLCFCGGLLLASRRRK